MKNKYKIDVNTYVSGINPVALFVKRPWHLRWEHIESFRTIEEAQEKYSPMMDRLPIHLTRVDS